VADDETLVNLATVREFQDDLILPVSATSEASVQTVGPDLELTKHDAGFVATAGQQTPFPHDHRRQRRRGESTSPTP
jgi:hypothetical protein